MWRRPIALAALLASLPAAAAIARVALETRVVPPLAAPHVEPGVARCTSDGPCTITGADGRTRPGPRLTLAR